MRNDIIIPNRLNWVDWAKSLAIAFVVFGHIPEERGSFLINYIVVFHMPLFFFISGYLTKKELPNKSTFRKYWHTLVIPYFFYNIIFYPYWVVRHIVDYPNAEWFDYVKPFIGTFMLQYKTSFSDLLNGVTWFISALLIMKILLAICNKYKYGKGLLAILIITDAIFYIINEHYRINTELAVVGFTKCFPFYFIGHFCKQICIIKEKAQSRDWEICLGGLLISLTTYTFLRETYGIYQYGIYFWTICISAIFGILSLCKLLGKYHSNIIDNISIGTIVIMGLHWILIGVTNFTLSKFLHLYGNITYSWYISICLTLLFISILYPVIIIFKNKYPFLLGKWKPTNNDSK